LTNINTPKDILHAIKLGMLQLEESHEVYLPFPDSPTVATAFNHQSLLSWEAFLRGLISINWKAALDDIRGIPPGTKVSKKWAGQLVSFLLHNSQHLWVFCCGVIHGHTKEESWKKHREDLQQNVRAAYEEYTYDPFCIPSDWWKLFDRPVDTLLLSDRDTLVCWLRSHSEARQQQSLAVSQHKLAAQRFFKKMESEETSSTHDSDHAPLSDDTSTSDHSDLGDSDDNNVSSILNYNPFQVYDDPASLDPLVVGKNTDEGCSLAATGFSSHICLDWTSVSVNRLLDPVEELDTG
jgi:hypothetical protein